MIGTNITSFQVGQYICRHKLGAGATGSVYLAVHLETGIERALKVLSDDLMSDPDSADAVLQALISTRKLDHPNIIAIYELVEDHGRIFVVEEFASGGNLNAVLSRAGPLDPILATYIASNVCSGLEHAHRQPTPIIHGALWPENVLFTMSGEVKIADFGAWAAPVRSVAETSIRTRYCYRSPEYIREEALSARSDIFGVGVLLYQMLAGQPPFLGDTVMQTVERVEQADVALDKIPAAMRDLVGSCLTPNPWERPADATALLRALRQAVPLALAPEVRRQVVDVLLHDGDEPRTHVGSRGTASSPTRPGPLPDQSDDHLAEISGDEDPTQVDPRLSDDTALSEVSGDSIGDLDAGPTQITAPIFERGASSEASGLLQILDALTTANDGDDSRDDFSEIKTNPALAEGALFGDLSTDDADTSSETVVERSGGPVRRSLEIKAALAAVPAASSDLPPTETGYPQRAGVPRVPLPDTMADDEPSGTEGTRPWTGTPHHVTPPTDDHPAPLAGRSPSADARFHPTSPSAKPERPDGLPPASIAPIEPPNMDKESPEPLGPVPTSSGVSGFSGEPGSLSLSGLDEVSSISASFSFDDNYDSAVASFDAESVSVSLDRVPQPQPTPRPPQAEPRFSAAHVLLFVAILVFAVAVGLLVRKLLQRTPRQATVVLIDAATPTNKGVPDAAVSRDSKKPKPRPAPTPTPESPKLRVVSTPPGTVYVGARSYGETPVLIAVKPRQKLTLSIVASRHMVHRDTISAPVSGTKEVAVKLATASYPRAGSRRRGTLRVICRKGDPRRILINGKDTGYSCPRVTYALWPARYKIGFYDFRTGETKTVTKRVRTRRRTVLRLRRKPRL